MATTLPGMFGQQNQQKTAQNSGIYSPELDWNTFNQNILQPYVATGGSGAMIGSEGRGAWTNQLGIDPGGRYSVGIDGLDRDSFFRGAMNPNLDDMGLATYQTNPNGQQDWEAAVQKAIADPNSVFSLNMDRVNADGSTAGGKTGSIVKYQLQNGKLVPVSQQDTTNSSWTKDFLTNAALFAGGAYGLSSIAGQGAAGAAGGMGGSGIPGFAQLPGYGTEVANLASATGASPFTGGAAAAAADPISAYLTTGAVEGSTVGGALAGGGASGAVGSGTLSSLLQGLGGAASTIGNIPGASKVGGSIVSNLLGSALGGGGVSTLGNLGSLFTNYNQYSQNKDLIDEIKGIYSPDGAYAKSLGEQLARKDAAAGRNSQYGPRLADLMGRLGDSQARALSGLSPMMQSQQGGLNGMVGAGSRLFDSMGGMNSLAKLFQGDDSGLTTDWALGPNGGPQMPTEDLDIWDLFGN